MTISHTASHTVGENATGRKLGGPAEGFSRPGDGHSYGSSYVKMVVFFDKAPEGAHCRLVIILNGGGGKRRRGSVVLWLAGCRRREEMELTEVVLVMTMTLKFDNTRNQISSMSRPSMRSLMELGQWCASNLSSSGR